MLKGYVIGDTEVKAKFDRMPEQVQASLKQGIGRAVLMVQRLSKLKLSDVVLHVRSGRLRRSVNGRVTESAGKVEGIVGTNVEYARPHEYGFQGTVTVKEHLRRSKTAAKDTIVRSHSRHVNIKERSFLRSALAELQPEIQAEIKQSIDQLWKQNR